MRKGSIHIGTSGWSYKHWKGLLYDVKMKPADYLPYYATLFDTTEINTSFYHLPRVATVEGWVHKVPEKFTFCPKISRYLTHMKKLHDPQEPLQRFFEVFEPMYDKLGPVLVQLPPSLRFNEEVAKAFFEELKANYRHFKFALEIRHTSWLEDTALQLMEKYNIALVISQSNGKFPFAELVTAKHIYYRFHGPRELYASSYSDEELAMYAEKFKKWQTQGHSVWAYFNNDIFGFAYQNALKLKELLKG